MKKTFILSLLLLGFASFSSAQQYKTAAICATNTCNWNDGTSWEGGVSPRNNVPTSGDVIEISAGHTIVVLGASNTTTINPLVVINVYGTIDLTGAGAKLDLDNASSTISIATGGNIDAAGPGESIKLRIGAEEISKTAINALASPNQITESTLNGGGGCVESGDCEAGEDPLPIELLFFKSNINSEGVALTWATSKEDNFNYFSIERSTNGIDYQEIAQINGAGYSRSILNYSFIDADPIHGRSYYRLNAIDLDLSSEYSAPITVNLQETINNSIAVSPNPLVGTQLSIITDNTEEGKLVTIYDLSGNAVRNLLYTPGIALDLGTELKPGVYMVVLNGMSPTKTKLVVR